MKSETVRSQKVVNEKEDITSSVDWIKPIQSSLLAPETPLK